MNTHSRFADVLCRRGTQVGGLWEVFHVKSHDWVRGGHAEEILIDTSSCR
jgi:hypothetical protein